MKIDQIPTTCKENDVVCCDIANKRQFFVVKNNQLLTMDGRHPCFILDHFVADYELVEAEPDVLTAEEWIEKRREMYKHPRGFTWHDKDIFQACEFFHQNGRLERDLEVRPAIEYLNALNSVDQYACNQLPIILKNLKPLNEDGQLKRESERA